MKLILKKLGMLTVLMALPWVARADNFNTTNYWKANATITSYPTNASGWYTGGPIGTQNYGVGGAGLGVLIQGAGSTDATNQITVRFIRSAASSPPNVYTNGGVGVPPNTQITLNDWEVNQFYTVVFSVWSTNATTFITNLPAAWCEPANYVGVWDIANTNTTMNFTNASAQLVKKIQTIRYP